jgi:hypothetical protein
VITFTTPEFEYAGEEYTLGFEFYTFTNLTAAALGTYDSNQDGIANSATVGIWDTSGNLLVSATVPMRIAGTLDG